MFVERKIIEALHGRDVAQLSALLGYGSLEKSVDYYGHRHNFTRLVPDLTGVDPDDAFSSVPYEKGFNFLYHLQGVVGGPDAFAPFIKAYVAHFAVTPLTSLQFRRFFEQFYAGVRGVDGVDWEAWFHAPGLPPVANTFDASLSGAAKQLAARWLRGDTADCSDCGGGDVAEWTTGQFLVFLEALQCGGLRDVGVLSALDAAYGFARTKNAEVRFRWDSLCIAAEMESIVPDVVAFITEQGRMKFVRPLYRALRDSSVGRAAAYATFDAHKDALHPICRKMVARDLGLEE